ncbi:MAG TPA: HD domain-containing phosphohydrolase, partial [Coriobacteriia bacterium]
MSDQTKQPDTSASEPVIIPGGIPHDPVTGLYQPFQHAVAQDAAEVVYTVKQTSRARDLLARLSGARRSVTFYPRGHVVVKDNLEALMKVVSQYHSEGVDVPLIFFNDEVMLGDQLLASESVMFDQLIRDMQEAGMSSVNFRQGLNLDELERAMQVLAKDQNELVEAGGLEAAIRSAQLGLVEIGTVAFTRDPDDFAMEFQMDGEKTYNEAIDALEDFNRKLQHGKMPSVQTSREAVNSIVDNVLENKSAMLELAGLMDYDEYTFFHSVNVTILSIALGSLVSSNRRFLNSLGVGALMHDIGKMTVELDVLNKSGSLSADEWNLMRMHPVYGAEVAAGMRGLDRSAIVVILEHHMRYDLDGYPDRRPRRPQHLTSRIVAIADAYDAMTSRRTYAVAHRQDEAIEVLNREAGTSFDPVLVRMFTQMLGVYPPRTIVRVNTGEVGVVLRPNTDMRAPWVRMVTDPAGAFIDPFDVDLSDPESADGRHVEACL